MQPPVPKLKTTLANLGLLYTAAIWGATFFIVKSILDDINPVILVSYRFLLAGLVLLIYLLYTGRSVLTNLRWAAGLGVLVWLMFVPQTVGLKYTTASNSGFITGLFVAFVPLFSRTIFKRRPTTVEVAASGVSLSGLWILTGGLADINIGDILTLGTAMCCALHILYADKYMKAGADPYVISCQQFMIAGLLSLLTGLVLGLPFSIGSATAAWTVVFLALFPTLVAIVIQMQAQRITSPTRVSMIFAFEPVFAAMFAWTLGGEIFVLRRALGGLFIFAALVLSGFSKPGRSK